MSDRAFDCERYLLLDGAMGTQLLENGLCAHEHPETAAITSPDIVEKVHREYVDAGADIILANTFGANRKKLMGGAFSVENTIAASIEVAKRAAGSSARVALDIGPLGELLEPSGLLSFEEAYDCFAEIVCAGVKSGAQLVYIETMTDLLELKCALLAVRENCSLPVVASMSFERGGRTFTGCPVEAFALTATGLGADALGINCSLGPLEVLPIAKRLCEATPLPIFIKPNAGLPDPISGKYDVSAESFARSMELFADIGVSAVGGCCGTTPEFIAELSSIFKNRRTQRIAVDSYPAVCSGTLIQPLGGVLLAGERINPTGNKLLASALSLGDFSVAALLAVEQEQSGATVIDVNVGIPLGDEPALLSRAVKELQDVCALPLMLDSSNPIAIEAALRVYCGKPIVNSVNASAESLSAVLPLCKKYGAAVVGLTLSDGGIPESAQGRLELARKICAAADSAGIPRGDIIIDCLTTTLGAQQDAAQTTLDAISLVKRELGVKTVLGVSNVSHGLPARAGLTAAFMLLALGRGLDVVIANPKSSEISDAITRFRAISGQDDGCERYITRFSTAPDIGPVIGTQGYSLHDAIVLGLVDEAHSAVEIALSVSSPMKIVSDELIPALDEVGSRYESGEFFLPRLLRSAESAKRAFAAVNAALEKRGDASVSKGRIVVATVRGDIHDIGKNIVKTVLQNYGYEVLDLGRDVSPERVAQAALKFGAGLVGLSALMTTTLPSMSETISALRRNLPHCKTMVGGAVVTEEYACSIGADYYARDAKMATDIAKKVFQNS